VVVTASVNANAAKVFEAMGWGALDAVDTPALHSSNPENGCAALLSKIDMVSRILGGNSLDGFKRSSPPVKSPLVVIGASAGGPSALAMILGKLPRNFAAPVVLVQHVDEQFAPSLASWLAQQSILPVVAAKDGDRPGVGQVSLAVKDHHLVLRKSGVLGYSENPRDVFYRPSVDVFFESVAEHWTGEVIGVLLTGMGRDGAKGLKRLRDAGHHTIAQDQESCAVYGMPKAAAQIDAAVEILPLSKIAFALEQRVLAGRSK